MRRSPELAAALVLLLVATARAQQGAGPASDVTPAATKPADAKPQGFAGLGSQRSKDPITITSDTLEYAYRDGIVVYRGDVLAVQGEIKIRSNELRITLAKTDTGKPSGAKAASEIESANTASDRTLILDVCPQTRDRCTWLQPMYQRLSQSAGRSELNRKNVPVASMSNHCENASLYASSGR